MLAGPKNKKTDLDAASNFFDDPEMDAWFDDDVAEAPADDGPALPPAAAAPEDIDTVSTAPAVPKVEEPDERAAAIEEPVSLPADPVEVQELAAEAPGEPDAVQAVAAPPAFEVAEGPAEEAVSSVPEAAPTEAAAAHTAEVSGSGRAPVAPPPPPRFSGSRRPGKPVARGGFLDSILPRTLEPPPLATTTPRVGLSPELVETLDGSTGRRSASFSLLSGSEAWQEAVGVIELELEHAEDPTALLVASAWVRLHHLRDRSGARAKLSEAEESADPSATYADELRALQAIAFAEEPAGAAAWSAIAEARTGAAAADAWRRAAQMAPTDDARMAALLRAVNTDPDALSAWDDLLDLARRRGDNEGLVAALSGFEPRIDESLRADVFVERGAALWRLGRLQEALEACEGALALVPSHEGAVAVAVGVLEGLGEHGQRAQRLEALATRHPQDEGAWAWAAARAYREAGEVDAAGAAYLRAVRAGFGPAATELEAWWLEEAPERLVDVWGEGDVEASWRLALTLESKGIAPGAARALFARVANAGCATVRDVVDRALERDGDHEALVASILAAVSTWDLPRPFDLVRLAEAYEAIDPASPDAAQRFREAADRGDLEALRGLARVLRRRAEPVALGEVLVQLSEREIDPAVRAARASEAGQALLAAGKVDEGLALLGRAAEGDGGRVMALEAASRALEGAGRPIDAAIRLEAHARELTGDVSGVWWLEVARLRKLGGDVQGAISALEALVAVAPGHEVAQRRLARLAGAADPERLRSRLLAEGTELGRSLASSVDVISGEPMDSDAPSHLRALRAAGNEETWRGWLADEAAHGDSVARVAWCAVEASVTPSAVAAWMDGADGPTSSVLAHLAERLGRWSAAAGFCSDLTGADGLRRAAAAGTWGPLESAFDAGTLPLARMVDLARAPLAPERVAGALEAAAEASEAPALRAMLRQEAAELAAGSGRHLHAAELARRVLLDRPGTTDGLLVALTSLALADQGEAALALYEDVGGASFSARDVARWVESGSVHTSVKAWQLAAQSGELLDRLGLEIALVRASSWEPLYAAWSERREQTLAPGERERLESKRRWLLAEKLASSEVAWDLYVRLHEEQPEDREITENLARIAGARGDVETSLTYLRELAATAPNPRDAARAYRRVAEVLTEAERFDEARQALLDALGLAPDDLDALERLRDLAGRTGDPETLLVALQREYALVDGERRTQIQREIAHMAIDQLNDLAMGADAWRSVLTTAPGDLEALRGLVDVARRSEDDALLLDAGRQLAGLEVGAARAELLRGLGERCLAAGRDDEAVGFLEEAIACTPPDLRAGELLEATYREFNDHDGLVRALVAQANASTVPGVRASKFREGARREAELRHDREAAHALYLQVLEIAPDDVESLRFEARFQYEQGDRDAALALHERLLPLIEDSEDADDPDVRVDHTELHHRMGEMLQQRGDLVAARKCFDAALALNPAHLPTLEAVGPLAAAAADWKETGAIYNQILQLTGGRGEPESVANIYTMLGLVDLHAGRDDKALKRFNRATEAFPNYVPALKGLASVHERHENWQAALTAYNSVIYNATVPDDVTGAYIIKGRILDARLGRPDKAAQHYERCLAFEASQPEAYLRLAELELRAGRNDEAADWASRGLGFVEGVSPFAGWLHLSVAIARARSEDGEGARAAGAMAVAADPALEDAVAELPDDAEAVLVRLQARLA